MADYSQLIFGSLDTIGQRIAQNRADKLAAEQWDKSYAQRLLEDQTNWDWRQKEADRAQANADRSYSLDLMKANGTLGGGDEYGLNPVYATDDKGNVVGFQTSKTGKPKQLDLPPGFKLTPGVQKVDLGTAWGILNRNGDVVSTIPKDVSGEAAAKKFGDLTGQSQAGLRSALASGDRIINQIDELLKDPALSRITGPIQGGLLKWMPNVTGGANRAQSRLDQILGGTFLQAYNDLRGGGQITEAEGAAAKAAYNRLQTTGMSDADYRVALQEFRDEVLKLMQIARARALGALPPVEDGQAPNAAGQAPPNPQEAASIIDAARAAIAAGKDPAAVADRLRQLGIDPSQLGQ